jgi:hypothetical protein
MGMHLAYFRHYNYYLNDKLVASAATAYGINIATGWVWYREREREREREIVSSL